MPYTTILKSEILSWTTIPQAYECACHFSNLNSPLHNIRDVCTALAGETSLDGTGQFQICGPRCC